jgi:hypothetical protein
MDVVSDTHLNCLGHRIYTSAPGTDVNHRSKPEVAIRLTNAFGVKIQNCVIDGFDFPILAHDIKLPADAMSDPGALERLADRIVGNTISGVFVPVELVKVDNMRIENNTITNTWGNGQGIFVLRNSQFNQMVDNTITRASTAFAPIVYLPGPSSTENPTATNGGLNIYVSQGTNLPNLINLIFGGILYQYPNAIPKFDPDGTLENGGEFVADNVVEGNTINTCGGTGCLNANAQRTLIVGNQISNVLSGIGLGVTVPNLSGAFPGKCTPNQDRWCLTNSDCNIPSVGSVSQGTCSGVATLSVASTADGAVVTNNTITGPFKVGMQLGTPNIVAQGNTITGPVVQGDFTSASGAGIEIRNNSAIQSIIITQNVISNVPAPVRLFNVTGNVFAAQISLNDFTGYTDEAFLPTGYNLDGELSVGLQGNYWGLPCSPAGGGGFDPSKVLVLTSGKVASDGTVSATGPVSPLLHDSHPYGVPVANTDPALLPTTLSGGYCAAAP